MAELKMDFTKAAESFEKTAKERGLFVGWWIPVDERLPEDRRAVLVTAYWHETYQVMMGSYYGDGLWWCVPFNNCGEHMQRLKPKAWMPLPKPYEPQESEREEMTLDEAIRHTEQVAEEQDKLRKRYDDASGYTRSHNEDIRTSDAKQCERCAEEHRQLAKWLRKYQKIEQIANDKNINGDLLRMSEIRWVIEDGNND